MSDEDIRRLRRIITEPAPPTPGAPSGAGLDRFQRVLGNSPSRRSEAPREERPASRGGPSGSRPSASAPASPAAAAKGKEAPQLFDELAAVLGPQDEGPLDAPLEDMGIDAAPDWTPVRSSDTLPPDTAVGGASSGGSAFSGGGESSDDTPAWVGDLAKRIGKVCRRADPAFESFSVTVPLNAETLPDTDLTLSLSPHRLALRFVTQSTQCQRLIFQHRDQLIPMLLKSLPSEREIDIEIE